MERTRLLLVACLACVLIGAGLWWFGTQRMSAPPRIGLLRPPLEVPADIEMRLNKVRIHGIEGGKIAWEIDADHFELTKPNPRPVWRFTGIKQVAILNGEKKELTVSTDLLERDTLSGSIALEGSVMLAGDQILMRAPAVRWDARKEVLTIPKDFAAKIGDIALTVQGDTSYDLKAGVLKCHGGVRVGIMGNTMRAGSAVVQVSDRSFTLHNPVTAVLKVADMEDWAEGRNVPALPSIPEGIKKRYEDYCRRQQAQSVPAPTGGPR